MKTALKYFKEICQTIEKEGLTKNEKIITSPQGARVQLSDGRTVINMCANNYLGLGNNSEVISAAKKATTNTVTGFLRLGLFAVLNPCISS